MFFMSSRNYSTRLRLSKSQIQMEEKKKYIYIRERLGCFEDRERMEEEKDR